MTGARFDLIILDFDGTLVDSAHGITACLGAAFTAFALDPPAFDQVRPRIGLTLEECIRQLTEARGFRGDVAGIASVYRDLHVSTAAPGATLFPRAEAFLAVARASGCSLALVSQKSRRGLAQLLSQFSIERFFELVLGADDVSVRKPDPALFTRDIRSRFPDVDVQRVLVVGDTPTDLQFARNIGACSCWAEYGYGDVEQCLALMPTYRISAIADLSRVCGFEGV